MSASFRGVILAFALASAAFSSACRKKSSENASTACDPACPAGQVCAEGRCRPLCENDTHCPGGQVCTSEGVCITPADSNQAPQITAIDGTGSLDGNGGHTVHHLRDRLLLTGQNLQGASGALQNKATGWWQTLSVAEHSSANILAFYVPEALPAGEYVLRVTNDAGSDETEVWLLQGEPGLPGNVTMLAAVGDSASTGNVRSIIVDGVATESEYLGNNSTVSGLYVLLFDLETHAIVTDPAPQVYGSSQYAALTTVLEAVADTTVVLVASAGDVSNLSAVLIAALQDVGASDAIEDLAQDTAYALVGRGGTSIETLSTDNDGIAYAATLAIERTLLGTTQGGSAASPFGALEDGKLCQFTGGIIACTASAQSAPTETDPTVNSLAKATLTSCYNGDVVKWNGAWGCASDETGGSGVDETQVDAWVGNNGYLTGTDVNGYLTSADVNDLATATLTCNTDDIATYGAEGWTCLPLPESSSVNALATAELNCTAGEFVEYNGSHWGCAEAAATGNALANAELNCTAGQTAEYNGTYWGCSSQSSVNALATAELNCTNGQFPEYNSTVATWRCRNGIGTVPTCSGSDKLTSDGTSLTCAPDIDTNSGNSGGSAASCNNDGVCEIFSANINGATLEGNGGVLVVTGGLRLSNSSTLHVYRCKTAGNLREGVLTTMSSDCGSATDTGLIVTP